MPNARTAARDTKPEEMDAIQLLTADHKEVKAMFKEFESLKEEQDADDKKADLVQRRCTALTIHATIEEELFYPAVRDVDDEDLHARPDPGVVRGGQSFERRDAGRHRPAQPRRRRTHDQRHPDRRQRDDQAGLRRRLPLDLQRAPTIRRPDAPEHALRPRAQSLIERPPPWRRGNLVVRGWRRA